MYIQVNDVIVLKLLQADNAESLFALTDASRPYLREWLPWVDGTVNVGNTREFIEFCEQQHASNNGFNTGIWYKGELAGCIGYHAINWGNKKTSIGYWLGQRYQGNGIMSSSCKKMVDYAFHELGLNRVEIRCGTGNAKSRAIPERLGFVNEGVIRQAEWIYDRFIDHVVYGMLKQDWSGGAGGHGGYETGN
ncbi:GNAT family N-acetyltransferase [Paenibacillus allorhizosphaerae]|uniref:Ribosomal N-acetyltransferase YdaF n=1 Tax=Paenibacillus allorhizosphaerae TaxID=2849866 RepID=A0ABN7TLI7_9BACL|nr:GNAT family protein [Paenibacillus allorhizosphaerae]CAG7636500.1 Putative ribosomal N-acetyltransferase YdaF [Paenibacillus allorhizosphaerae]